MRYKNLFWGILLITIGVLWLLQNQHSICFNWSDVWKLWPFILVWIGIGIIPIKDIYKICLDVVALGIAIVFLLIPKNDPTQKYVSLMKLQNTFCTMIQNDSVNMQTVHLKMDLAAGKFSIIQGKDLLNVIGDGSDKNLVLKENQDKNKLHADIDLDFKHVINTSTDRDFEIQLDTFPLWDLEMNMGAAKGDFDLSEFKVNKIKIDAGVSNIDLKIGQLYSDVNIELETGMASIKIDVPLSMQCIITNESGLSNLNLEGFIKQGKGVYISENKKDNIKGTVKIYIESGMSNIHIDRY